MHLTQFFDRDAPAADGRYRSMWARISRPAIFQRIRIASALVRALGSPDVLDLGCGTGHGAIAMCDAGARSITGIDLSTEMLRCAERNVLARGLERRVTLVAGDAMTLPDRAWDLVVAVGVLEYYANPVPLLTRMAALTRAWVLFSVRAWTPLRGPLRALHYTRLGCPIYFLDRTQIAAACRSAGYRSSSVIDSRWGSHLVMARIAR